MKDTPNTASFIGYEYKSLTVNRRMESVYADGYQNFGWKLEDVSAPLTAGGALSMKFKRDRKIRNKAELTRLQRQFEACADEIVELERSKTVAASITAYIIGLIGTAFMAGLGLRSHGGAAPRGAVRHPRGPRVHRLDPSLFLLPRHPPEKNEPSFPPDREKIRRAI